MATNRMMALNILVILCLIVPSLALIDCDSIRENRENFGSAEFLIKLCDQHAKTERSILETTATTTKTTTTTTTKTTASTFAMYKAAANMASNKKMKQYIFVKLLKIYSKTFS